MSIDLSNEKIIGVVQARMGSSRLQGKVMTDIVGKPLVWHIVDRLRHVKNISKVVISTTDKDSDKPLREFAEAEKIEYYAGSENNILDRLYQTGKKFNATVLVKVNGDCPLVDPEIVDLAISKYSSMSTKPDLIVNSMTNTYPEGLQYGIFNFKTLCDIWQNLKDIFWQEYVLMYIVENHDKYAVINVENDEDLSHLRWTVDYKEDLDFVREVYKNLYNNNRPFKMLDILSLLKRNPEIQKINSKHNTSIGKKTYEKARDDHNNKTRYP